MKVKTIVLAIIVLMHKAFAFGPFDSKPYLTPTTSPTNSIYISWNSEILKSTIVAYGLTCALNDTIQVAGERNYHHVELTGLSPNTHYFYRIVPDGDIRHFTTFPASSDTFAFVAFGDTRSDSAAHQSVIDGILTCDFAFATHVGDFINDGYSMSDWRTFFNVEDTLLGDHHFLPAIGNHEAPFWPYDTLFILPDSEDYYSLNYGNAHVVILNTEIDLYGVQRDWLINDLILASNDSTIDWIFASFHRPPYSSGNHGSQMDVRNAWCSIFEQYNVDIAFAGHDHDYERTISINDVVYIVTGGGGAPLRHVDSSWFTAYSESTYQFCLINVIDRKLELRAIKPDGTVFDSLFISKPGPGVEERNDTLVRDHDIRTTIFNGPVAFPEDKNYKVFDITGRVVMPDRMKSGIYFVEVDGEIRQKIIKIK